MIIPHPHTTPPPPPLPSVARVNVLSGHFKLLKNSIYRLNYKRLILKINEKKLLRGFKQF
jgi:hypothetical protein